jgi:hypothetical protein
MPDFDLDEASDILKWEVAEQTTSPGARTAIRQSHRRRATIGAATAAALVAIGGVVLSLTEGDDQVLPAGPDTTLPDPAPLDATALDAATRCLPTARFCLRTSGLPRSTADSASWPS